jgi:hypothetical protein
LVTHLEHPSDVRHRHILPVGGTDGLVALLAQLLSLFLQLPLALAVSLGKGFETGFSLGGFSFRSCDLKIVKPIPANRFA